MKIVFSSSRAIGSYAIRAGTISPWSHVDMLCPGGTLIGAVGSGVERTTLAQRLAHGNISHYRVDEIVLPNEDAAWEFAQAQVGKDYDYTAIVAFAFPWRGHWADDDSWFCSELAAATCQAGGQIITRGDVSRITPGFLNRSPLLYTVEATRYL